MTSVQDFDEESSDLKEKIGPKLEQLAGAWPHGKAFVGPKKQMLRLLKGWNMKVEFCINVKTPVVNGNENSNGLGNGTNSQKKKKKKKHKTQERLREEKEMKMKMARDQENSDVPSFSTFVSDNINNEDKSASDKLKRKADSEEEKPPLKAKKKKKSSK